MLIGRTPVNVKRARKRKEQGKHRLYLCPEWYEVTREIPEVFRMLEQESQRRSGSGTEVLLNILSVEVNGTGAISA